jgi:DtxR family Mn-dependent transcriptional regulator
LARRGKGLAGAKAPTPRAEEYLETIYMLHEEGQPVIGARLAEILGISRATVTVTLKRLQRDGLVAVDERKHIVLTQRGAAIAGASMRRHRLVERLLTDVLGMDWARSDAEAHSIEHCISPEVEEALNRFLGYPSRCPHGNPIPFNPLPEDQQLEQRLANQPVGTVARVVRVAEPVESAAEFLEFVQSRGLVPGVRVQVVDVAPGGGPLTLIVGERPVSIEQRIASLLWVIPELMAR